MHSAHPNPETKYESVLRPFSLIVPSARQQGMQGWAAVVHVLVKHAGKSLLKPVGVQG